MSNFPHIFYSEVSFSLSLKFISIFAKPHPPFLAWHYRFIAFFFFKLSFSSGSSMAFFYGLLVIWQVFYNDFKYIQSSVSPNINIIIHCYKTFLLANYLNNYPYCIILFFFYIELMKELIK